MADVRPSPWPDDCPRLKVDDLLIDLRYRHVIDGEQQHELSQRHFELLCLLLASPGVLHHRNTLLEAVWSGVVVEDANLSQAIWTLRRALGAKRRDWIRTVAKRGYVFEPGCAVLALPAEAPVARSPADAPTPEAAQPGSSSLSSPNVAPRSRLRRWSRVKRRQHHGARFQWRVWVIASIALALLLGSLWLGGAFERRAGSQVVAVMEISRPGSDGRAPWPATLLRALIEWPLTLSPSLQVLSQEQLARDRSDQAPVQLLLVSASEASDGSGSWWVQASLQGEGGSRQLGVECKEAELPAAVAALAARVVNEWLAVDAQTDAVGARLSLDQSERYVEFVRAKQGYDWPAAAKIGRALLDQVPEWGMAQLQLAAVLGQLGEVQSARHHLQIGRAHSGLMPGDLEWRVRALAAELEGDEQAALDEYRLLERRYPERAQFSLEVARMLLQRGEVGEALERIDHVRLAEQPLWIQVRTALMRSQGYLQLGDAEGSRQAAQWALSQAQAAGWLLEQGQAELNLAAAEMIDQRGITGVDRYRRAADLFEQGGDELRALVARMEAASSDSPAAADQALQALLARARQVGHRQLEINALLIAAFRYYRDGDLATFRRLHGEAKAVAEAVGNQRMLMRMELDLVGLDLDAGDFSTAEQRMLRVRELGPEGESAFWLEHFGAVLEWRRGRYQSARQRTDAALQALQQDGKGRAVVQALGYCARGALAITAGQLSKADNEFHRCARSDAPIYQLIAELGHARVALFAGDRARATESLTKVQNRLEQVPALLDRRGIKLELLDLWARADATEQAGALIEELSQELANGGGPGEQASLMLAKARISLLQGDQAAVSSALDAAAQSGAEDDWQLQSSVRLLTAYLAHARGDSASAEQTLQSLIEDSRRKEDVVMQVEAEAARYWIDPTTRSSSPSSLLAETGLRGIRPILSEEERLADSAANL